MRSYPKSAEILANNRRYIPGGVVSTNRAASPEIVFVRGEGAYIWNAEGDRFIDYHAAFAPHILGHNDPEVNAAVERALRDRLSLFGTGASRMEGRLAELICTNIPWIESLQLLNSGSEATSQAIRLARAATRRDHVIVMQGGYNGWHNDVACNLMTPLSQLGPRIQAGEYPFHPMSAGIPKDHQGLVHAVNFNDLDSVESVCRKFDVAGLITEPVLQNIGLVPPAPGYLQGLRKLADQFGFILIFDEVKTGFRHGFGGMAAVSGVRPDVAVYGKAIANGYPMAALGGRKDLMDLFVHPDAARRVLLAGTYNAHPVPTAAAVATLERLLRDNGAVYARLEALGGMLESLLSGRMAATEGGYCISRIGSAFSFYFMDHVPADWHDLATHHDFEADARFRQELIELGIYVFPLPTKQWSISAAHTEADIAATVEAIVGASRDIWEQSTTAAE